VVLLTTEVDANLFYIVRWCRSQNECKKLCKCKLRQNEKRGHRFLNPKVNFACSFEKFEGMKSVHKCPVIKTSDVW